jgi:formylmethanofuran--tetrahydromethanopterin N-formyltransferase
MIINGVEIEDGFAEAFPMRATRIVITAATPTWAMHAANTMTGFATSVIACGCEAGIERTLEPAETPDGRPGVAVLLFTVSSKLIGKQLQDRIGQCVLTCPSTACYAGMEGEERIPMGKALRYFGDGYQISKRIGTRRYWRVPVMDGEFLCEEDTAMTRAVGGGNFLILAETQAQALAAAETAVAAMRRLPNVIMPFPGGVVRSGSKVGSKYPGLLASTNDAYCPTIQGLVDTQLTPEIGAVLEIVIDGLSEADVAAAMRTGVHAACGLGVQNGIRRIGAGNYGGKLGPYHFRLRELLA